MEEQRRDTVPFSDLFLLILAPLAALAATMVITTTLRDGDTGWHLATGQWIVEHLSVPRTDPFSFAASDKPWVAHEWLSELLMYGTWRAGGWPGVMLLFGSAAALVFGLTALHLRRWQSPGAAALMLVYLAIGASPALAARPHMLALPMLVGWVMLMMRARDRERAPPLALALMMLVWANMHGSFVLGIAVAGLFGLEALVYAASADRLRVAAQWGAFGAALIAAGLATPAGLDGLLYPFYVNNLAILKYISEWQSANFATTSGFEVVLLSALFFMLYRPVQVPVVRLILLIVMLHLALQHIRQESVLVVVGVLILAEPLGRAWADGAPRPRPRLLPVIWAQRRELAPLIAVAALLFAGAAAARLIIPFPRPDSRGVPITALAHLPPALRAQPVFNEYSFGGLLIMQGIRPFIDGRSDMYGDAFTTDYYLIANGDAARWRTADAKWKFGWTILPPDSALVKILDQDKSWQRIYADKWAVIHVTRRPVSVKPGRATDK